VTENLKNFDESALGLAAIGYAQTFEFVISMDIARFGVELVKFCNER
jgi:hypothetical protein